MADIQSTNAAAPAIIHRQDYSPPDWFVPEISLDFTLDPASTQVRATLSVTRNGAHERPLILDGDGLSPMEVQVDGRLLQGGEWMMKGDALVIPLPATRIRSRRWLSLLPRITAS